MAESESQGLFRQEALERLSSPERLDELMKLVTQKPGCPWARWPCCQGWGCCGVLSGVCQLPPTPGGCWLGSEREKLFAIIPKSLRPIQSTNIEDIYRALRAGAKGYLLKDVPCEELFAAIRQVYGGQKYIMSQVA